MDENKVTFKGTVNGLTIILPADGGFEEVFRQVDEKLATAGRFFKGASLAVKYRGRKLSADEEHAVMHLLVEKSGADITGISEEEAEAPSSRADMPEKPGKRNEIKKFLYFRGIDDGPTRFYRGTVRSGQLVNYEGNVVVIGDVNPGGVVEAAGNVVVVGNLRGIVHAGSDGNKEAVVVALCLKPTQLRIADVITRSPDEQDAKGGQFVPEIAFVKDNAVYIERFLR